MPVGFQQFAFRDKLHPLPMCQPAPVNPAAVPHPLEDDIIQNLVDTKLIGAKQVKVAIDALKAKGVDLTVVAAQFPPPPAKDDAKTPEKTDTPPAEADKAKEPETVQHSAEG